VSAPLLAGGASRIAVFRALNLGDLLCFVPALRALRHAFPQAWIALVGLESARPVAEAFPHYVDELLLFPGIAAFPEQRPDRRALPAFYESVAARRFDVALQMHGDGTHSNEVVRRFGARRWGGFVPGPGQAREGRFLPWPDALPEARRYLALLNHLGLEARDAGLEFPLDDQDRREAAELARRSGIDLARTVLLHPGARLASRRWPVERFAAVARRLAAQGWQVAVTGSPSERVLAGELVRGAAGAAVDLSGGTSLGGLAALLRQSRLLICNDTGISHVAAAVGAPSVVIASGSDVKRWAPANRRLHQVLHQPMPCRPCAYDECPVGHGCALAVTPEQVLAHAGRALRGTIQ